MFDNLLDEDADPDPASHFDADPDPASQNDADLQLLGNVRNFQYFTLFCCQELRKVDLNAKMSKSKKKRLKKREKRNQQLMEEAMKHAMEAKVIITRNQMECCVSGPDSKRDFQAPPPPPIRIPWTKKILTGQRSVLCLVCTNTRSEKICFPIMKTYD
jgi:hypothetical protein